MCGRKQRAATAINGPGQDDRGEGGRAAAGARENFSYHIMDIATDFIRLLPTYCINYQLFIF